MGLARKRSSLASASGMARFTPRSSRLYRNYNFWPRLVVKWTFARSFTSTDLRATTAWSTWATRNSYGSIIQQTNSVATLSVAITSTANCLIMGFWGAAKNTTGAVQRNEPKHLLLVPQRMRVPLQPPWPKSVQNSAYTLRCASAQLVMTLFELGNTGWAIAVSDTGIVAGAASRCKGSTSAGE